MKGNVKTIRLHDLVDGFLFSLKAEGKAPRTWEYYSKLLHHFLLYSKNNAWAEDIQYLDTQRIREFLSWTSSRTYEHSAGNGVQLFRQANPKSACPYYRALRRIFNWAVEEGLIEVSPLSKIHFKPPSALS